LPNIRTMKDIVDWNLCCGCGACYYYCDSHAVTLVNREDKGIRPVFNDEKCDLCSRCLGICPGFKVISYLDRNGDAELQKNVLIGPPHAIYEGYAVDKEIRWSASSGGILTGVALYCLEVEGMGFVLHTGMDSEFPWLNKTVQSRSKKDLMSRTGSRYATSSPCEGLMLIENSQKPCVFIGKPCDAGAVELLRSERPRLDKMLALVMTFFCAGTPSTNGTKSLLKKMSVNQSEVNSVRYRGEGWPGQFKVSLKNQKEINLSYNESWGNLQRFRPLRCHICPDGLGEVADISCGDAWNRYDAAGDIGRSLILARTKRGQDILERADRSGYIKLLPSSAEDVEKAQGLIERRKQLRGRLIAMRMLSIPTPHYEGFFLRDSWIMNSLFTRMRVVLGTIKRMINKGFWHRGKDESITLARV
jgi:coenzyme F420 hydrogenase subunit beta